MWATANAGPGITVQLALPINDQATASARVRRRDLYFTRADEIAYPLLLIGGTSLSSPMRHRFRFMSLRAR